MHAAGYGESPRLRSIAEFVARLCVGRGECRGNVDHAQASDGDRHRVLGERGKVAGAQRYDAVVEIVTTAVQKASALGATLAEAREGAGLRLQHEGEVFGT